MWWNHCLKPVLHLNFLTCSLCLYVFISVQLTVWMQGMEINVKRRSWICDFTRHSNKYERGVGRACEFGVLAWNLLPDKNLQSSVCFGSSTAGEVGQGWWKQQMCCLEADKGAHTYTQLIPASGRVKPCLIWWVKRKHCRGIGASCFTEKLSGWKQDRTRRLFQELRVGLGGRGCQVIKDM